MKYKKRRLWKYRLHADEVLKVLITPENSINSEFIRLTKTGRLTIKAGYCWDGSSGPTIKSHKTKMPSLFHDAIYNLLRDGLLDQEWRKSADEQFRDMLIERGFWKWRADFWYKALRKAGQPAADNDVIEVQ